MRFTRAIEFPDCTSAEQAKDAVLSVMCVKVLNDGYGDYCVLVDEDGHFNRYSNLMKAVNSAKQIRAVVREPGTDDTCYQWPLVIISVSVLDGHDIKHLLGRSKLCDI